MKKFKTKGAPRKKVAITNTGGDIMTYVPPTSVIMDADAAGEVRVGEMITVTLVGKVTGVAKVGEDGKKFNVTFEHSEVTAIKGNAADRDYNDLVYRNDK